MSAGGRLKLGQILVSKGLISPEELAAALAEQETGGKRLGTILVQRGALDEEALVKVVAGQLRLPVARIRGKTIDSEILDLVPAETAEKHRCLPLFLREENGSRQLFVAMEDPSDPAAIDDISFRAGLKVRPVLVAPSELEDAIQRHYHVAELMPETPGLPSLAPRSEPEPEEGDEPDLGLPPPQPLLDPSVDLPGPVGDDGLGGGSPAQLGGDLAPPSFGDGLDDLNDLSGDPLGSSADDLDLDGEPFTADGGGHERKAPAPAPAPAPRAAAPRQAALDPEVLLQALAQLLVEKGIITRDEFAERVRRLSGTPR